MKPQLSASRIALAITLMLVAPATQALAQAGATVGVNAAIRNSVQMRTASDAALRPARVRDPVHIGDAIVSGPQSSLQMLLLDQSVFTVGSDANITIDRFVYDPNRGTGDIAASVTRGAFRFMSGRLAPGAGQSAIRTPLATIGVRGTIVQGVVGPDIAYVLAEIPGLNLANTTNAVLVLMSGPGPNNEGFDKPGAIDVDIGGAVIPILYPGQAILIWGPGQPAFGPFDLSDDAYARLMNLLNGVPGGNLGIDDQGSSAIASGDILNNGGQSPDDPSILDLPMNGAFTPPNPNNPPPPPPPPPPTTTTPPPPNLPPLDVFNPPELPDLPPLTAPPPLVPLLPPPSDLPDFTDGPPFRP